MGISQTEVHHAAQHLITNAPQRGGTLENSGEMLGWELMELRLRVTKHDKISTGSQMRNKRNLEKNLSKKANVTRIAQISPGEGLSEGLRGLMENSGNSGSDSARDSGELRGELRDSGTQETQTTHFGELRGELKLHSHVITIVHHPCLPMECCAKKHACSSRHLAASHHPCYMAWIISDSYRSCTGTPTSPPSFTPALWTPAHVDPS